MFGYIPHEKEGEKEVKTKDTSIPKFSESVKVGLFLQCSEYIELYNEEPS